MISFVNKQLGMFRRWSIRRRLMMFFTSLILLLTLVQYFCIYWVNQYYTEQGFIARLREKAILETQLFLEDSASAHQNHILQKKYVAFVYNEADETICIFNTSGFTYYAEDTTCQIQPDMIEKVKIQKEIITKDTGGKINLWLLYNNGITDYITLIRAYNRYAEEKDTFFRKVLTLGFIISVFLTIVIGLILTHIALRPFEYIVEQMNAISATNLNLRLTENKKQQDEINLLAKTFNRFLDRLEEAFNIQKAFVNNVSHELRTPLTTIIGEADIALSRPRNIEEYQRVIRTQLQEAEKLQKITNNLLLLAQVGSHQNQILTEDVRLDLLISEVIEDVKREQPQAQLSFQNKQGTNDIPPILLLSNHNLLYIAIKNLVENACKFSDFKLVVIKLHAKENKAIIRIVDEGIGIPEKELIHIFEPFYRAKNVESRKGSGIGMYLVKNIIALHHGEIKILSRQNVGTTVEILLKIRQSIIE